MCAKPAGATPDSTMPLDRHQNRRAIARRWLQVGAGSATGDASAAGARPPRCLVCRRRVRARRTRMSAALQAFEQRARRKRWRGSTQELVGLRDRSSHWCLRGASASNRRVLSVRSGPSSGAGRQAVLLRVTTPSGPRPQARHERWRIDSDATSGPKRQKRRAHWRADTPRADAPCLQLNAR